VVSLLVVALWSALSSPVRAQGDNGTHWVPITLDGPVQELFVPTSGALLARARDDLLRSDDGGATWTTLLLPPSSAAGRLIAVAPTNHDLVFASGDGGLYRSADGGFNWQLLRGPLRALDLAVSPVNPDALYLVLRSAPNNVVVVQRSDDGGTNWRTVFERPNSVSERCRVSLAAHPTDANRLFRSTSCSGGPATGASLLLSSDQGANWSESWSPTASNAASPARLAGGYRAAPQRLYLVVNNDSRLGDASLLRSDDAGDSWAELLVFSGGGTMRPPEEPLVTIGGLANDRAAPDRVYAALNECAVVSAGRQCVGHVRRSTDGGEGWEDLGHQDLAPINSLALGVDGRNLYAATGEGLWRLPLPR
jgi:photosystem II stability/assembly factor-like uncharacterized protein